MVTKCEKKITGVRVFLILKEYTEDESLYCHGFIINTSDKVIY